MFSRNRREFRSNSMDFFSSNELRKKNIRLSSDTFHPMSQLAGFNNKNYQIDPLSFISLLSIVPIPTEEWMRSHIKNCCDHISNSIFAVQKIIDNLLKKRQELQINVTALINKNQEIVNERMSFQGRGLCENRGMFFLINRLHTLKIKLISLSLVDVERRLKSFEEMKKCLSVKRDFSLYFVSVNLRGFSASIPNNQAKIEELNHQIKSLESCINLPKFLPPPEDIAQQLVYPTSSTLSIFTRIEKEANKLSFTSILDDFRQMTDNTDEMNILIDLAFSYAWRTVEFPFINSKVDPIPSFLDVRVSLFLSPHIPKQYEEMHIGQLMNSDWPYKPVVDTLFGVFFLINPIEIAKVFFDSMTIAGQCINSLVNGDDPEKPPIEIDFDTIFPLILICVLVSGILSDQRIIYFVATLGKEYKEDSICQLGSSYAEAILTHILGLKEEDYIQKTRELDSHVI